MMVSPFEFVFEIRGRGQRAALMIFENYGLIAPFQKIKVISATMILGLTVVGCQ